MMEVLESNELCEHWEGRKSSAQRNQAGRLICFCYKKRALQQKKKKPPAHVDDPGLKSNTHIPPGVLRFAVEGACC